MPSNKAILLCSACGWKQICNPDFDGVVEIKNDAMGSRKFRCPKCGRGVCPRSFPDPQSEMDRKARDNRIKSDNEAFMDETMEFQRRFIEENKDADKR